MIDAEKKRALNALEAKFEVVEHYLRGGAVSPTEASAALTKAIDEYGAVITDVDVRSDTVLFWSRKAWRMLLRATKARA